MSVLRRCVLGGGRRGTVGLPSSERACSDSASRRRHCAARARGIHRVAACACCYAHSAYGSCSPLRRHDRSDGGEAELRVCATSDERRRHHAARPHGSHRVAACAKPLPARCVSLKSARALHSGGTIGPMRRRRTRARGSHRVQRLRSMSGTRAHQAHTPTFARRSHIRR